MNHPVFQSDLSHLALCAIDAELLALEDGLLAADGEITEEVEAAHDHLFDVREDKVEGYLRVIRRLETTAEAVEAERQRLQRAEWGMTAAAQTLKDCLAESMRQRGDVEYLTSLGRLELQRSGSEPVELLVEAGGLPDAFVRFKRSPDLTALHDALCSEDPGRRGEAERVARLGEAKHYVQHYVRLH